MTNKQRREFLRLSSVLLASSALPACGGGGKVPVPSNPPTSTPPPVISNPGPVNSNPGTAGVTIANARFTLRSSTTQQAAPFCLGYAFRRGDVPVGRSVGSNIGALQVTPKNVWPDGSLKFAVIAGQTAVPAGAGTTVALQLINATPPSAALGTAQLRSTGIVAEIGCGTFGTARWEGADWDSPFRSWVSGPVMSSWIYRKPVGADPHLVAWLEVRLWASGAVEVLPWIENGYLQVAAPTNKSANYSFSLGGKVRMSAPIDLKHHQRTPLISGTALSYWLGNDSTINLQHDKPYLQATELVPSYMAKVDSGSPIIQKLATTFQPLQAGNFIYDGDSMASPGYQDPIGLLPEHDVLYLVSDADIAYAAVVRNGFSAGRYGIHYRDETTQRPIRFSKYPTLNIGSGQGFKDTGGSTTNSYTPAPLGGNPPGWDVAHSPSVGYMAYLITGRWYFMEEVQFAATANYLGNGDNAVLREGSKGIVKTAVDAWQTRSCAWDWRARVQALCVTPDNDPLRSEFIASVEANIEHFHGRYVAQRNNPYGWIKPGDTYNGTLREGAPWQQDFVTAAFGYAVCLGLPISDTASTKLAEFFQWKAKSVVMRLGTSSGFWYINGDPYTMMISPSTTPDYDTGTGPWYADDAAVYAATYAKPPAWLGSTEGVLAGEFDISSWAKGMWGNLQPAIAYAVRHNVPGAQAAYGRILGASNWSALRDALNSRPVWSVKPALAQSTGTIPIAQAMPAWLVGKALHQAFVIPNSAGAGGAPVWAYGGYGLDPEKAILYAVLNGGHSDSSDNRVTSFDLSADAPSWVLRSAPTPVEQRTQNTPYYADGKPSSRHTYDFTYWVPQVNRVMQVGFRGGWPAAYTGGDVVGFNPDTNTWDPPGTWASTAGHASGAFDPSRGHFWTNGWQRFDATTNTYSTPISSHPIPMRFPVVYDPVRDQMFCLQWGDTFGSDPQTLNASKWNANGTGSQVAVTFNDSPAYQQFLSEKFYDATHISIYHAMTYDSANDCFYWYNGRLTQAGHLYVIRPNSGTVWDMELFNWAPGSAVLPSAPEAGICGRLKYVPKLKGFILCPTGTGDIYFVRTS